MGSPLAYLGRGIFSPLNKNTMLGYENLEKAILLGVDLGEQVAQAAEDGFSWTDTFGFLPHLIKIPGIISKGDEIIAEFKDLDDQEREAILAKVKEQFDLPNDKVEEIAERALALFLNLAALGQLIKGKPIVEEGEGEAPVE